MWIFNNEAGRFLIFSILAFFCAFLVPQHPTYKTLYYSQTLHIIQDRCRWELKKKKKKKEKKKKINVCHLWLPFFFCTGLNISSGSTGESLRKLETSSKQWSCENLPANFPHSGLIFIFWEKNSGWYIFDFKIDHFFLLLIFEQTFISRNWRLLSVQWCWLCIVS